MKSTGIQWADDTSNPTSGCDGCELWKPGEGGPCYAGNFHENRLAKSLPLLYDQSFSNVRLIPGRIAKSLRCMDLTDRERPEKPWLSNLRRKIFVGDLGDIFSEAVPFDYLKTEIFDSAISPNGRRHDMLLLTKQPGRAAKFADWLIAKNITWPDNVWIGTSITGKASLPRIKHLAKIPAKHKYLSLEPLVEDPMLTAEIVAGIVDWIIVGGESDQGVYRARPFDVAWAMKAINIGEETNIAVFIKQFGSRPIIDKRPLQLVDGHGGDWLEWPEDTRVRQMPFGCE